MALLSLDVVNDTLGGGQDDVAEQTGWEESVGILLDVRDLEVETWRDNGALVQTADQVDDGSVASSVVDNGEIADVVGLLHLVQELNDNWVDWADDDLAFTLLLSIADVLESVTKNVAANHSDGCALSEAVLVPLSLAG